MAERRMFAKTIIDSDAFLDMPLSTQALYFHLSMRADDEGFINNPKKIQRMVGASEDDLKLLIAKKFIIPFESGIVVIKHWKIHNYIRGDRIKETVYAEERSMLTTKENGAYTFADNMADICQADDGQVSDKCPHRLGKVSIGKDRLVKDSIGKDNTSCSQLSDESVSHEANVEAVILNDQSEWRPSVELYEEYVRLYPNVDIAKEFRSIRAWCIGNPAKLKTRKGVLRFVNSWLEKAQNRRSTPNRVKENVDWVNV